MFRLTKEVRKKIVDKWLSEKGISFRKIAQQVNTSHKTVGAVIKKYGEHLTFDDISRSGRKTGTFNKEIDNKVVRLLKKRRSMSIREIAKKCGASHTNIQKIKHRHGLRTYKKYKIPKRSEKQQITIKTRARKLYEHVLTNFNGCILMDDETYVKLDGATLSGPQFYTKKIGETVSDVISSIAIEKFGAKMLVWQAICSCGKRTSSFFAKGTIKAANYREECLQKRFLPFVTKHHGPILFWPDLASAHYAKTTLNWLKENNINFVEKNTNPPNCPFLRPIERYWALVMGILRKQSKENKNIDQFKNTWNLATKKVSDTTVRNLMSGVKSKLRKFVKNVK